jgi:hypothetical protein
MTLVIPGDHLLLPQAQAHDTCTRAQDHCLALKRSGMSIYHVYYTRNVVYFLNFAIYSLSICKLWLEENKDLSLLLLLLLLSLPRACAVH